MGAEAKHTSSSFIRSGILRAWALVPVPRFGMKKILGVLLLINGKLTL